MVSDLYIRLRSLIRRHRVESELDTELRFHMEREIRKYVESGMSPADAERRARLEFGGVEQIKEECRQARGIDFLDNLARDVRYGLRKLAHDWRFSLAAVLILTLAIGANTVIFSFVNSVLFRPRPFESPDRLVNIYQDSDSGEPASNSFPAYRDMLAITDVFSGVAAWYPATARIESGGSERSGLIEYTTSSLFPVLGVKPSLGRWFTEADEKRGAEAVGVLTRRTWIDRWGADPDVIGSIVHVNGAPVTIVGVGPEGFSGGYPGVVFDLWMSLSSLAPVQGPYAAGTLDRRQDHWFQVQARLADGVEISRARAAMNALASRLAQDYPSLNEGRGITVFATNEVRMHPTADSMVLSTASLLVVVMALVLGIAASNLAILLLVRGTFRAREVAVRLAMGATRRRVASQLLVESVMLSLLGGSLGLLLAGRGLTLINRLESVAPVPVKVDVSLDHHVLIFTFLLSMLTGIAFGLVPALRSSKADLTAAFRDGSEVLSTRHRWFTFRNTLVVSQVAASFLLLVAAGLLIRSLENAGNSDVGFRVDDEAILSVDPGRAGYEGAELTTFSNRLLEAVRSIPGVESAARVNVPPFRGPDTTTSTLVIDGYTPRSGTRGVEVTRLVIDPDYLGTLDIPLFYGRNFTGTDTAGTEPVAIINQTMARRYYGKENAVGGRFRPQASNDDASAWIRIVGVVGDTKVADPTEDMRPVHYLPVGQIPFGPITVMAHTAVDPEFLLKDMRAAIRRLDPDVPILRAKTMRRQLEDSLEGTTTGTVAIGAVGLLSLGLAAIGLYAVVTFSVSRRSVEIGIRMALGCGRGQVLWLTCREVLTLVGTGLLVGLGLSIGTTRAMESLLFGVSPVDPLTLVSVVGLLAFVSAVATYLPVRRATARNPLEALRHN